MIAIFCHIILVLGDSVMLVKFKLEDEFWDVSGVKPVIACFICYTALFLGDSPEVLVGLIRIHIKVLGS